MKKILILVAGESNLPFIESAKKLGLHVITCDNNRSNPGHKIADENLFIDVYDHDSIIEAIKDKNIDGVMSFVSAHGLNTASIISEHYHLKGYSQTALKTLTDKGLFRDFLSRNNLNFPAYQCVHNLDEIDLKQLTYPIIIKPTDKGGSQGVIKINNENELLLNFQTSKNFSDSDTVIIEEFLEGEELINGDCLIYNGEIIGSIVGNYIYDNETNNVLPIATVFPANYDVSEALKQVSEIVKTLKIPDGIINFEAIARKNIPYIVEINPRPSGNYIWKLLGYKYSVDIPALAINLYFNSDNHINELKETKKHSYAYQLIYSDKNKIFKGFKPPSELENNVLDINFFHQENTHINSFNNLYDRIGIVLLEFKDDKKRNYYMDHTKKFRI
jgi:biotin carboxylase